METPSQGYSQAGCRESSAKLATREIAPHRKGVLPISVQTGAHNEAFSVAAVRVNNPDCSPVRIHG